MISLKKAQQGDLELLYRVQVVSFRPLLEKYRDYETSPAAESIERIVERFEQDYTDYLLILEEGVCVGMMRVCNFGDTCRISPICILPEYQGRGYSQKAMLLAEATYSHAKKWTLDTIAQEAKLCYLYEKLGYRRTGKQETIKPGMDIVFYEKRL